MKKEQLLIINKTQFGYHTDYYKYCQYLKSDYNITHLSFYSGHKKLEMDGVHTFYVPWIGPKWFRGLVFILYCLFVLIIHRGLTFIHYFEYCEYLKKLFPGKKMILDIRTLSVHQNAGHREKHNTRLKKACKYFDHITVISKGVREQLNLETENSTILPLGADVISTTEKQFSDIRLLYVGTFNGRNISETIEGLHLFLKQTDFEGKVSYDIVGDGAEKDKLHHLIEKHKLQTIVKLHGRIPHFELKTFFDRCNIGVSYVPMTDYYEYQPPTKTFEYILSGLVCIATATHANSELINNLNGILCNDTPIEFSKALKKFFDKKSQWNSAQIRASLSDHTWENIVHHRLEPILEKVH